jgi:hypothetical protein
MQNKLKVGIIILHFGSWEITKNCLDSLSHLKKSPHYQTYLVVVNNSRNKTVQNSLKKHKYVDKAIFPAQNLGFAAGNNLGATQCIKQHCDYILILNNDTIISSDFVREMLSVSSKDKSIACLGPVIKHLVKDKFYYDFGGYLDYKRGQPKHLNKTRHLKGKKHFQETDFVSGCCLLTPTAIIQKLGFLKESYFMYLEDVEYCLRCRKNGFKVGLATHAEIFHLGSQSATQLQKIFYSLRNSLKLTLTYIPPKYKLQSLIFNLFFYPALFLRWQASKIKGNLTKSK